jgi:rod shape-determining protein MreC
MRSLLRFVAKYHVLLLFLVLEIISFSLIFNYNNIQRVKYLNTSNRVTGTVYESFNRVVNYFKLAAINEELALENSRLKSRISNYMQNFPRFPESIRNDDSISGKYTIRPAIVINNSVAKQYNYITLDKGTRDGIKPDQGIISDQGIIGVVSFTSENYSTGISLLNRRFFVSGKLKNNDFFGSVQWDGTNYRYASLLDIPSHAEVEVGDTVVTRGSSVYFPEGIMIGTVESFDVVQGESFFTIRLKLAVDFKTITYVEVVENNDKQEILSLEEMTQDDQDNN